MPYESNLKYFRDQYKNPDKYENNQPASPSSVVFPEEEINNQDKKEKKIEKLGFAGEAYKQTIDLIKSAGLKNGVESNLEESVIIENRRQTILNFLKKVLEDASNYLSQVNYLQLQKLIS